MRSGPLFAVGTANSVRTPAVVRRATRFAFFSVNHRLPSGAFVMAVGAAFATGSGGSSTMLAAATSVKVATEHAVRITAGFIAFSFFYLPIRTATRNYASRFGSEEMRGG